MKTIIQNKLKQIEAEKGVRILFACESGSRGWGFPSPDSDYDVRFVYAKSVDAYLSIRKSDDFLNFPFDNDLDINGWDFQKALGQLLKSNAVLFEWLQSPIIYTEDKDFREDLLQLAQSYFCPRTNVHHYLGIAKGAMQDLNGDEIKIKKLFYVLRPLLSALWCLDRNEIAPMNIVPLMELLPTDLKQNVLSLIDLKTKSKERFTIELEASLKLWVGETLEQCTDRSKRLEKQSFEEGSLNEFFRKRIKLC